MVNVYNHGAFKSYMTQSTIQEIKSLMAGSLIQVVVDILNRFPSKDWVSDNLIP